MLNAPSVSFESLFILGTKSTSICGHNLGPEGPLDSRIRCESIMLLSGVQFIGLVTHRDSSVSKQLSYELTHNIVKIPRSSQQSFASSV